MGHDGSKTWLLGQILEKPCVGSRGHIFSPIIMKLGHSICLDEVSDKFEKGSCWSKTRSLGQTLEKPCISSIDHIFSPIIMFILIKSRTSWKMGYVGVKN